MWRKLCSLWLKRCRLMRLFTLTVAVVCNSVLLLWLSPSSAQEKKVHTLGNEPVVFKKPGAEASWLQARASRKGAKLAKWKRRPISKKKLLAPMTKKEMRLLIHALEPVRLKKGGGWAIRAVVEGSKLHPARMRVLFDDTIAILADLHGNEVLGRLKQNPGINNNKVVGWMEKAVNAIHWCAEGKFADRGKELAFAESVKVVEEFRPDLERLLVRNARIGILPELEDILDGLERGQPEEDDIP